jgi:surface carbohydrate biosynthesis protein (TIGR04326 family)
MIKNDQNVHENELWVCWIKPNCLPSENIRILSYLKPSDEEKFIQSISEKNIISGRSIAQEVKDDALKLYTKVVAKIGADRIGKNSSLRMLLKSINGNSLWWYHPVSFKDFEADPTFNRIIQILVVDKIASENNFENIIFWGADDVVEDVLKSKYQVECKSTKHKSVVLLHLRAFLSRLKQLIAHVYQWYLIRNEVSDITFTPDVVFEGFWDWSVRPSAQGEYLDDRYFKSLADLFEQQDFKTAWLLWFDPHSEPQSKKRSAKLVLNGARPYNNLIFLQKYLKITDIIKSFSNFSPLIKYYSIRRYASFKNLCKDNELNFFPIFREQLSYHFMSSSLPHYDLVEKACIAAFAKLRPKIALTFLEMFTYSRALYAGARQGSAETKLAAMQHASYSREKTFIRFDPEIEFYGKPDSCPVPRPDFVFTMCELGKEIFQECGFASHEVFLTGSARYDHIRTDLIAKDINISSRSINLLIVTSLDCNGEMDMVDAVYSASKDLSCLKLFLRNHPFNRMDKHNLFQPMKEHIRITRGSLEDDLQNADLIVFSYSTVAEEALIRGIPVWQWCSAGYNASAFREIGGIPTFYSVSKLRDRLKEFIDNPYPFIIEEKARKNILNKCFYKADGKASERIKSKIIDLLN